MNKIIFIVCVLLAAISATAGNYFTVCDRDTLRIQPSNGIIQPLLMASSEGYFDSWTVYMSYPEALDLMQVERGDDMNIPYITSDGSEAVFYAMLSVGSLDKRSENGGYRTTVLSSIITTFGYWDRYNNGNYERYGTVKWPTGYYERMAELKFAVNGAFTGDSIVITGQMKCTEDWRGVPRVNASFRKVVHLVLVRPEGDINCDGEVNIADVTALIRKVLNGTATAADDVNGDGAANIADVTALIRMVLRTTNL